MARQNRFLLPGCPQHVIQRGNNRQAVFIDPGDYAFYLDCMRDACLRCACDLHAYVLMTNHVHLLISPRDEDSLPRAMQSVGKRYAQRANWRRQRTGTLWEGRYRAAAVDTEGYFFTCSKYIELNPVRAGMVRHPADYRWSSYAANANGARDARVVPHPVYLALGDSPERRSAAYRMLFDAEIAEGDLDQIRSATHNGWPLGRSAFCSVVEQSCKRRARPLARGGVRPGAGHPSANQSSPTNQSSPNRLIKKQSIVSDPID